MKRFVLALVGAATLALAAQAGETRAINNDAHFPEGPIWHGDKPFHIARDGAITLAAADPHGAHGLAVSDDGKVHEAPN